MSELFTTKTAGATHTWSRDAIRLSKLIENMMDSDTEQTEFEIRGDIAADIMDLVHEFCEHYAASTEEHKSLIPEPRPHQDFTFFQIYQGWWGHFLNKLLGPLAIKEPPPECLTEEYKAEHLYTTFDQMPDFKYKMDEASTAPPMIIDQVLNAAHYLEIEPLTHLTAGAIGFFMLKLPIDMFEKHFGVSLEPIRETVEINQSHHVNQKFYNRVY